MKPTQREKEEIRKRLLNEFPDGQIPIGPSWKMGHSDDGVMMTMNIADLESHDFKHPIWWMGSAPPRRIRQK